MKPSSYSLSCAGGKARESRLFKAKDFCKTPLNSLRDSRCITWHHLVQKPADSRHDGCLLTLSKSRSISKRCGWALCFLKILESCRFLDPCNVPSGSKTPIKGKEMSSSDGRPGTKMLRSHRPSLPYGLGHIAPFKPPFLNYRVGQMTLLRLLGGTRERIRVIMLRANTLLTARLALFEALCMHLLYPHTILCGCYFYLSLFL